MVYHIAGLMDFREVALMHPGARLTHGEEKDRKDLSGASNHRQFKLKDVSSLPPTVQKPGQKYPG